MNLVGAGERVVMSIERSVGCQPEKATVRNSYRPSPAPPPPRGPAESRRRPVRPAWRRPRPLRRRLRHDGGHRNQDGDRQQLEAHVLSPLRVRSIIPGAPRHGNARSANRSLSPSAESGACAPASPWMPAMMRASSSRAGSRRVRGEIEGFRRRSRPPCRLRVHAERDRAGHSVREPEAPPQRDDHGADSTCQSRGLALAFHISRIATNGMARFIKRHKNQPTAQPGVTIMSRRRAHAVGVGEIDPARCDEGGDPDEQLHRPEQRVDRLGGEGIEPARQASSAEPRPSRRW